jgi:alpha/beta superfamily hydrolase
MTTSANGPDGNGHLNREQGPQEPPSEDDLVITFSGVSARPHEDGTLEIILQTNRGDIPGILHPCEGQDGVVLFVGGGPQLKGPADGLYERLAQELVTEGISSFRVGQRRPEAFVEAVGDTLAGISFLKGIGAARIALVGHSANGAVAIKAAAFSEIVVGVASLAGQTFGAQDVAEIAPRHLLVVHGQADDVLHYSDAQRIYDWAQEPKELVLYPGASHRLLEVKDKLHDKLKAWLLERVGPRTEAPGA